MSILQAQQKGLPHAESKSPSQPQSALRDDTIAPQLEAEAQPEMLHQMDTVSQPEILPQSDDAHHQTITLSVLDAVPLATIDPQLEAEAQSETPLAHQLDTVSLPVFLRSEVNSQPKNVLQASQTQCIFPIRRGMLVGLRVPGDSSSDESDSGSCAAPPFSPLSSECDYGLGGDYDDDDDGENDDVDDDQAEEAIMEEANLDEEQASRGSTEDQDPVHQSVPEGNETKLSQGNWCGFKIVGDNIDKGTKASYQRSDTHKNTSIHYFTSYAVKDRVDLSSLSDVPPSLPATGLDPVSLGLLPTPGDIKSVKEDFTTLVSR